MSSKHPDVELAFRLHQQINCLGVTENAIISEHKDGKNYKPRTLIDQTLELIDPTPNIYTLFVQFNQRFFWNVLLPVEVKWSNRMTSCAGVCSFHPRSRQCIISLSVPLLKLRPRKDLIETLLHEMIHGYLFLTNNNRDRDGHGPEFCSHMNRINKEAGTNITIYHSFHNEVRLYQQHWWRCNGSCQKKAPYFGTVRRAMNRAPGPSDYWWKEHRQTCGGEFIKIKEPENYKGKNSKTKEKEPKGKPKAASKVEDSGGKLLSWLTNTSTPNEKKKPSSVGTVTPFARPRTNAASVVGVKKLGNGTNNVHGWGTSGPSGSNKTNNTENRSNDSPVSRPPAFFGSSVLGGSNTGRSNLLAKFVPTGENAQSPGRNIPKNSKLGSSKLNGSSPVRSLIKKSLPTEKPSTTLVSCPICNDSVPSNDINRHVDQCLSRPSKFEKPVNPAPIPVIPLDHSTPTRKRKGATVALPTKHRILDKPQARCPVCDKEFPLADINEHVDQCLSGSTPSNGSPILLDDDSNCDIVTKSETVISVSSISDSEPSTSSIEEVGRKCLVCNALIAAETSLNDHLEDCIESVFKDDLTLSDCSSDDKPEPDLPKTDKLPCPVCVKLIPETLMNEHLDYCLERS